MASTFRKLQRIEGRVGNHARQGYAVETLALATQAGLEASKAVELLKSVGLEAGAVEALAASKRHEVSRMERDIVGNAYNEWCVRALALEQGFEVAQEISAITGDCAPWHRHGMVRVYATGKSPGDCVPLMGGYGFRNRHIPAQGHNFNPHKRLWVWKTWERFVSWVNDRAG